MQRVCDHDPSRPRLRLVIAVADRVPLLLQDAIKWAAKLYTLPTLFPEITGRADVGDADTRLRKRRTQRLEAIVLVWCALLRRCDLRTLRVGDQRDDGLCSGVPIAKLVEATGLTAARVSRALAELEAAGYINSVQPVEALQDHAGSCGRAHACGCPPLLDAKGDQRHRGFPSVRTITPLAMRRLNVSARKLKKARDFASAKWDRRRGKPASARQLVENRKARRRIERLNRRRERRMESGAGTAAGMAAVRPPAPRPADTARLEASWSARWDRLRARYEGDAPPPDAPPNERRRR